MTNDKTGEKSPATMKVILALVVVLGVLAAPVISYLGQADQSPAPRAPRETAAAVAKLRSRQLDALVAEFGVMVANENSTRDQIRSLASAISSHGESGRDALLRLLQVWNHPVILETVGGYGSEARGALPYLESLIDHLEVGCAGDDPAPDSALWEQRHVRCSDRAALRRQVLSAYIDIKFAPESQITKDWSKPVDELNAALITAVERDRLEATKGFLAMGANPSWVAPVTEINISADSTPIDCTTPLQSAIQAKSRSMIDLLFTVGADPTDRACSPLTFAVERKEYELLEILIKRGGRPNGPNFRGLYPLIVAVRNKDATAAKILLAAGASPNLRGFDGISAYELAVDQNQTDLLALFEQLDPTQSLPSAPAVTGPHATS